jgi:hypothetical protein
MRWTLMFIVVMACVYATPAGSDPHGHDLWLMNLSPGVRGRWVLLDAGRAQVQGQATPHRAVTARPGPDWTRRFGARRRVSSPLVAARAPG